ncbi:MAG: hypothetical protein QE487_12025 [Fluviicola sp.]|nr:hypothetical protein [Fluviicola sp.]
MKTILILIICIIFPQMMIAQEKPTLYQDESVKVSLKIISDNYAYLLEDYYSMFGGVLVAYKINGDDFIIQELDTTIIIDTMVFYENRNYKQDSVMLSFVSRINEFPGTSMRYNTLKYIINDSLEFDGTKMYKNDNLHRALIPQFKEPYTLLIEAGNDTFGPFKIASKNDIGIKIVVLMSSLTFEFDFGKNLPSEVQFKGKTYQLKHNFIEWK